MAKSTLPFIVSTAMVATETLSFSATFEAASAVWFSALVSVISLSLESGELQPAKPTLAMNAVIMAVNNGRLTRRLAVRLEHKVVVINNSVYQRFGWYCYKRSEERRVGKECRSGMSQNK